MVIPLHTSTRRWATARARWYELADALRERLRRAAHALRHAAARREFDEMDDRTLRDLGLHRSEIPSYFAESIGHAPVTRRHVARMAAQAGR